MATGAAAPLILVINPGSTSTRIGLYRGEEELLGREVMHPADELARFERLMDQAGFRAGIVHGALVEAGCTKTDLDAVVARGGALKPIAGGTYRIGDAMLADLRECRYGTHASNLGAVIAREIADGAAIPAFIVDPITVDELEPVARLSGRPEIERISIFHALNQKAAARLAADRLGRPYEETDLIVAHLGGGVSVGAHRAGRVVDVNNALNGDGPFAPTRSGGLPVWSLVELVFTGEHTRDDLYRMISAAGGVVAYLGTSDMREVEDRIAGGDERARLVREAMAYQIAKEIGACAAVLEGRVDAVVLTGGMARDTALIASITGRVAFIAPVFTYPGSDELKALAAGALRVLTGVEEARDY